MARICGIYCIENLVNYKKYIGQSINIKQRFVAHSSLLKNNKHSNRHLQESWNKYGKSSFKFYIIQECCKEKLDELETFWIKEYKTLVSECGYNFESGGSLYKIISEETKLKLRNTHKGENNSFYGKHHSEETLEKMKKNRQDQSGIYNPMYGKRGKDSPNYGKPCTEATKEKIRQAQLGEKSHMYNKTGEKHPNARKVFCETTGEIFNCIKYACEKYHLSKGNVVSCCQGNRNYTGKLNGIPLIWKYID